MKDSKIDFPLWDSLTQAVHGWLGCKKFEYEKNKKGTKIHKRTCTKCGQQWDRRNGEWVWQGVR